MDLAGRCSIYKEGIPKKFIRQLLAGIESPLILEIGCNDGADTIQFLNGIPDVQVECFEPDPRAIEDFRKRFGINSTNPRLHNYAISNVAGMAKLFMSGGTTKGAHLPDWHLSSSLLPPKGHLEAHSWCNFDRSCSVETRTLDGWAEEYVPADKDIDFVWADCQGFEYGVFEGGQRTLERIRWVYFEFDTRELYAGQRPLDQLLSLLPGFILVAIYDDHGCPNALCRNTRFDAKRS